MVLKLEDSRVQKNERSSPAITKHIICSVKVGQATKELLSPAVATDKSMLLPTRVTGESMLSPTGVTG